MAIAPTLPGVEITVEVDNAPLQEHHNHQIFEVPSGAEFSVRTLFSEPFDATMPVHADIYIDNNYIQAPLRETGDIVDSRGYKYAMAMSNEEGQTVTQKFLFSELDIGEP
ncbi:hypothetical protein N0V87_003825 [Didymella glomerata]|uniref:DUF7918 domain-containing protein n=1 Tax=Didymella glomerata TaxID=749621 RepID=A0A9W8X2R5_9PLEO|nr:hypothetical protein N0V87_003825 [Didymella glomerata]